MVNGDPTSMTPSRVQTFWSQRERALDYYDKRITHFEVHLTGSDAASKVGLDDIHCALAARPVGLELVVVIDPAGTTYQANHGALGSSSSRWPERSRSAILGLRAHLQPGEPFAG